MILTCTYNYLQEDDIDTYMRYIDDEAEEDDGDDVERSNDFRGGVGSDTAQDTASLAATVTEMAVDPPTSMGVPMMLDTPSSSVVKGKKRTVEDVDIATAADPQLTRNKKRAVADLAPRYGANAVSGRVTRSRAGANGSRKI